MNIRSVLTATELDQLTAKSNVNAMWIIFVVCVRQVAEHAAVPNLDNNDPRQHTRTVFANWLERLLFAPHHLNYHLEHHLLATIPIYYLR